MSDYALKMHRNTKYAVLIQCQCHIKRGEKTVISVFKKSLPELPLGKGLGKFFFENQVVCWMADEWLLLSSGDS